MAGRFAVIFGVLFAALAARAAPPMVSNVRGVQRVLDLSGQKMVDVWYDVADPDSPKVRISLEVSSDGGSTWAVPVATVGGTGIGWEVTPGKDRNIQWSAGVDWPGQKSNRVRFRVTATDDVPPAGTMVLIPAGNFQMGNSTNSAEGNSDELPLHTV